MIPILSWRIWPRGRTLGPSLFPFTQEREAHTRGNDADGRESYVANSQRRSCRTTLGARVER